MSIIAGATASHCAASFHPLRRSFDRLPDDFPYALLTLIVVGMAGSTLVLSQLQTRAIVKKKWE